MTPTLRPALVFIASPSRIVVEELSEHLTTAGSDIEIHALGELSRLGRHLTEIRPDLLVLDWSGFEYAPLETLVETAPVVILDATPSPERKRQALSSGAFEYLPFEDAHSDAVLLACRRARKIPALELELRETEERYAAILDAVGDGIFVIQGQKLTYVNDRFAGALGFTIEELTNRASLEELAPAEQQDDIRQHLARIALSSGGREVFDVILTHTNGERRSFELACRSALMNGRRAIVGAARDVTAIRQLTREVEEHRRRAGHSERLRSLGEIAAGVAHDFNNVLEVILGRIDLIRVRTARGDDIEPHLGVIATAAEDAASILDRVKEFTRPSQSESWKDVEVSELLYDATAFCRTRVPHTARLEVRVETTRTIRGNAAQLREVLVNLLNNALDSISERGRVEVACYERGGVLHVSVADDGPGVPAELRERIFEPFFTTKQGKRGTGLGLSVSREILRRHDIALSLESEPHERTCFELRFGSGAPRASEEPATSNRVLVVDDDRAVGDLIADVLADADFDVHCVRNAEEACRLISEERFRLLVTDLDLDGDSGWELARAARRLQPELMVGLVTGWPIGLEATDMKDRGVDFVLTKPFSPQALLNTLERLIKTVD